MAVVLVQVGSHAGENMVEALEPQAKQNEASGKVEEAAE